MTKKIFCISIMQELGGNIFISADSEAEAKESATQLLETGEASVEPDYQESGAYRILYIDDATAYASTDAKQNAEDNAEKLLELND